MTQTAFSPAVYSVLLSRHRSVLIRLFFSCSLQIIWYIFINKFEFDDSGFFVLVPVKLCWSFKSYTYVYRALLSRLETISSCRISCLSLEKTLKWRHCLHTKTAVEKISTGCASDCDPLCGRHTVAICTRFWNDIRSAGKFSFSSYIRRLPASTLFVHESCIHLNSIRIGETFNYSACTISTGTQC